MLILAGATIATLTGENGILTRANDAKQETEEAEDIEKIRLAMSEAQIGENGYQELYATNFQEALNSQFEGRNIQLSDNGDGSYTISLDNNSKMFYADSDGQIISNENMIEIGTAEELKAFRDEVNSGNTYEGKYVKLTSNITLDINEEWEPIGLYPNNSPAPDDEKNKPFKGIFDGDGYEINGIYIATTDKVQGLFGLVIGGKILNLGIGENCSINEGTGTAGLVGYLYDGGSVTKCYNKSDITGDGRLTAGIVGQTTKEGLISQCYNSGSINSSGNYIGGICGHVQIESIIQDCYNSGQIIGEDCRVAGICGENFPGKIIQNCYNTGDITGKNELVGGITGVTGGKISNCYNVGNIMGETKIGGISGEAYKSSTTDSNTGIINNTYLLEGTSEKICGFIGTNVKIEDSSVKTEQEMKI